MKESERRKKKRVCVEKKRLPRHDKAKTKKKKKETTNKKKNVRQTLLCNCDRVPVSAESSREKAGKEVSGATTRKVLARTDLEKKAK
jgi:hypothetical protein